MSLSAEALIFKLFIIDNSGNQLVPPNVSVGWNIDFLKIDLIIDNSGNNTTVHLPDKVLVKC